jgi:hypothetical protein
MPLLSPFFSNLMARSCKSRSKQQFYTSADTLAGTRFKVALVKDVGKSVSMVWIVRRYGEDMIRSIYSASGNFIPETSRFFSDPKGPLLG